MTGFHLTKPNIQALTLSATKHLHKILGSFIRGVGSQTGLTNGCECLLLFLLQIGRVTEKPPHRLFGCPLPDRRVWSSLCSLGFSSCGSAPLLELSKEPIHRSRASLISLSL